MTPLAEKPDFDQGRIARRIRAQMQRHDLTIPRLARHIGVAQALMEEIVAGNATPIGPLMAAAIAPALRCTPAYLLTGEVGS